MITTTLLRQFTNSAPTSHTPHHRIQYHRISALLQSTKHHSHVSRKPVSSTTTVSGRTGDANAAPIAVVAFGGNALLKRGEDLTMENQQKNAQTAAEAVATLIRKQPNLRVCVTHGNGPQVGLLAEMDPMTGIDVLDAETEGEIGYVLELELSNALQKSTDVVAMLTQVVVDPKDPAFRHPTKFIGRSFKNKEEIDKLAADKGWTIAQDGDSWRRVVASPEPKAIVEARAIEILLKAGVIVIACGGGGIPVAVDEEGSKRKFGVQAVVDKDAASALLAANLGAAWLIMLTDAAAVYDPDAWQRNEKIPLPSPIACARIEEKMEKFPKGSMGPKMAAACWFVRKTGGKAAVGNLEDLTKIMSGVAGTVIVP